MGPFPIRVVTPINCPDSGRHPSQPGASPCVRHQLANRLGPRRFVIYYGWPSQVNGAEGNVTAAVAILSTFPRVVLGGGNVLPDGDSQAKEIVLGLARARSEVYGYISIGLGQNQPSYSLTELARLSERWACFGAVGLLADCAGQDFGVEPARFRSFVEAAHGTGLRILANAWAPEDVLGSWSPLGSQGDGYLSENDLIKSGAALPTQSFEEKLAHVQKWQQSTGIELWAVCTTPPNPTLKEAINVTRMASEVAAQAGVQLDWLAVTDPLYGAANNGALEVL